MTSKDFAPVIDRYGRRHPRRLIALNVALLAWVVIVLLMTTDAPVVLYQAF